jgi:hypothetical protein
MPESTDSEEMEAIVDLEECATRGQVPPETAKRFRIRVNKDVFVIEGPKTTGRKILELSKHTPVEQWRLDQRFRGGATKKIELNETVDLRAPGVERFMTLPLDQTEGGA